MQAQQNDGENTNNQQGQDTRPIDPKLGFRPNLTPVK
jgi:hypothetical protein